MNRNGMKLIALILIFTVALFGQAPLGLAEPPDFPEGLDPDDLPASFNPAFIPQNMGQSAYMAAAEATDPSKITLELKGVEVLDVLKILSKRSDLNIVAGRNVRGQVTLYLKNVLIEDALDTVITTLGLAYVEEKGIIKVMTEKEYEEKYGRSFEGDYITKAIPVRYAGADPVQQLVEQLKSPKGKATFDVRTSTLVISDRAEIVADIERALGKLDKPLETKVFRLGYANVADLEEQIQEYLTPEAGLFKVDKRTNQVTVTDRAEKLEQIADVINALDTRPPQVLIEAQIIEVDLFDAFRYGIDWDFVRKKMIQTFGEFNFQPAFDVTAPGSAFGSGTLSTFTLEEGLPGVDTVVRLLQNVGKTNTLSSPRITVLNNEEAKLVDATRQPYVSQTVVQGETSSQTADNIEFVDVGVTMTVVPTIADDRRLVLKLKPEVSVQSGTLNVQSVSDSSNTEFTRAQIPIVSSQTLETTVIVETGHTLVVGGLIKDSESKTERKLPFLSDIPILGAAFRSESIDFNKTELVIFLTPYIVTGEKSSLEHDKYFNEDNKLHEFDIVGGFDYGKGLKHSQGAFRKDRKPYWRMEKGDWPNYFSPKDLYERTAELEGRMNQFQGFSEGEPLFQEQTMREAYRNYVAMEVRSRIKSLEAFHQKWTKIDLAVHVRRDGALESLSFIDPGKIETEHMKRFVLMSIQEAGSFRPFPEQLTTEAELFDVRIKFKQ